MVLGSLTSEQYVLRRNQVLSFKVNRRLDPCPNQTTLHAGGILIVEVELPIFELELPYNLGACLTRDNGDLDVMDYLVPTHLVSSAITHHAVIGIFKLLWRANIEPLPPNLRPSLSLIHI